MLLGPAGELLDFPMMLPQARFCDVVFEGLCDVQSFWKYSSFLCAPPNNHLKLLFGDTELLDAQRRIPSRKRKAICLPGKTDSPCLYTDAVGPDLGAALNQAS